MARKTSETPPAVGYVSLRWACEYLGISDRFARSLISEGRLKAYRLNTAPNGPIRLRREDLDQLLIPIPTVAG